MKRGSPQKLPMHKVLLGGHEHWFMNLAEKENFLRQEKERLGRDLVVADQSPEHH